MSNCQVPMPTYERPEPVGELVDSLKRENDALKERVRELESERRIWLDGWAVNRITELESLVRDWAMAPCAVCDPWDEHFSCEHFDGHECALGVRMTELGLVWEVD